MNRFVAGSAVLAIAVAVAACGSSEKSNILSGKRTPDEFAIYTGVPLKMPPAIDLPPPTPGSYAAGGAVPRSEGRETLLGERTSDRGAQAAAGTSRGTVALLDRSGALGVDPAVRDRVNRESKILSQKDMSFTERLMFWSKPTEYGTVVDAQAESRRIRENQAQGRPVAAGQTPVIERKRRALLEGVFEGVLN